MYSIPQFFKRVEMPFLLGIMILVLINPGRMYGVENHDALPPRFLSELENRLVPLDEVLIATADLEAGVAQLAHQRNRQGWKIFAGAGVGVTNDTALTGDDSRYTTYDLRAGMRRPLLGRADAEQRNVLVAQTSLLEKEQWLQLTKRQGLSLLRQSYVRYWAAQEKLQLSQTFLAGEPKQRERLTHRQQAGYLLEADRLEFFSAFDLVRRNYENVAIAQGTALHTVQRLTGITGAFTAFPPDYSLSHADLSDLPHLAMESYPTVVLLRQRLQGLEQQVPLMRHTDTSAHFDVYTGAGVDDSQNFPEYSVGINLSIELPVGTLGSGGSAPQQSAQALATKCRRELAFERETVGTRVKEMLASYRASDTDILFATRRLQAITEQVRQNRLRTALEGDSLERLQQSHFTYYQAAIDAVDAQARQWNLLVSLLEYSSAPLALQGEQRHSLVATVTDEIDLGLLGEVGNIGNVGEMDDATVRGKKESGRIKKPNILIRQLVIAGLANIKKPNILVRQLVVTGLASQRLVGGTSLYVWQSAHFRIKAQSDPDFLNRLQAAGVHRILLSLDQGQIDALADPSIHGAFTDWLRHLHGRGFRTELLLGEPSWILPEHRFKLLAIITSLAHLPFSGLHLDLEPDQLEKPEEQRDALLKEWIATVAAAKKMSPWPVGVSMHPRYFQVAQSTNTNDLGAILTHLGISEVALMVYVSNPDRVAQVVDPILKNSPGMRFSVAQSVELALPVQESHYHAGRKQFSTRMTRLQGLIKAPNFAGLLIQDWIGWQEMKP